MRNRAQVLQCVLAAAIALSAPPVPAKESSGTVSVSATVVAACTIKSVQDIAFGTYRSNSSKSKKNSPDVPGAGSITVLCTSGVASRLRLGQGSHPAAGSTQAAPLRQLSFASATLNYALYQDASHSLAWGDADSSALSVPAVSGLTPRTVRIYALLPGAQDVPAGLYCDTLNITLDF